MSHKFWLLGFWLSFVVFINCPFMWLSFQSSIWFTLFGVSLFTMCVSFSVLYLRRIRRQRNEGDISAKQAKFCMWCYGAVMSFLIYFVYSSSII